MADDEKTKCAICGEEFETEEEHREHMKEAHKEEESAEEQL